MKIFWIYGLSGSGKTTLSFALKEYLIRKRLHRPILIDADVVRAGLSSDLGFSMDDRRENIRRLMEIGNILLTDNHIIIINAITPKEEFREQIKKRFGSSVCLIALDTSLKTCKLRDDKGLYAKASKSQIENFTGISSDFDTPLTYDIKIDTEILNVDESVKKIIYNLEDYNW